MIATKKIYLFSTIVQSQGNVVSDMDGEKVMLSINSGKYYNLGKLGGEIWELIKEPTEINTLVNTLVSVYEVELGQCQKDVLAFIENLYKEGLIHILNQGE